MLMNQIILIFVHSTLTNYYNFHTLCQDEVTINYVKLHAEPTEGKTLDISKYMKIIQAIAFDTLQSKILLYLPSCKTTTFKQPILS